jgi:hypothetical protein
LKLFQHEDILPLDQPTLCFARKGEPKPDTSGLYSKLTRDEILSKLKIISKLEGHSDG